MQRVDDILRQLKEEEKIKANNSEKSFEGVTKNKIKSLQLLMTFFYTIGRFVWKIVSPVYGFLQFLVEFSWGCYKPMWERFAYKNVNGSRKFSKLYGIRTLVVTLFALWISYYSLSFLSDVALYAATVKSDEVVYLSNAQEIDPNSNIHSVQGCQAALPGKDFSCSVDQSLYFRIVPSLFSEVWSILHKGELFFPDYVAATVAPGWQKCTITSFGFRAKLFLRGLDIYPTLLTATCEKI